MQSKQLVNEIKEFPMLSCLTESEITHLTSEGELKKFRKHDFLFESGQKSDEIFFLIKGVVKVTTKSQDGREVIKTILHPKAILSEHSLADEKIRTNDAIILTLDATVLAVKVSTIQELMVNNSKLAICIINFIGRKLKYAEERLESLALSDARERIVQFLKVNAESFGQSVGFETLLKHDFTQQDIASFTGTSRQTVTTILNDLKKNDKIFFKRKAILIRDIASLA
ncbi:MAG: Crp/Fnr family transcriptional regulator [Saprospiraceae bacterium]|nr:Crp/Fnr family transcriptional regulator [Saprospiraceae bacterium]